MKKAIALGTFDGLHKGHMAVLSLPEEMRKTAVVFPLPPKAILSGEPCSIMTAEDKCTALKKIGIDEIFLLDFNEIKDMPPEDFLRFLKEKFSPDLISCGFNYRFGKKAAGNTELLREFCRENGIKFNCCGAVNEGEEPISSTKIREYLKNGEIENANKLIAFPFSFTEEVVSGDRRGRMIGFPTVNQRYPSELIPIKFGVYKSKIIVDGVEYDGITNIGVRPTWQTDYIISETYIIGFSGDLYGKEITTVPTRFVRKEVKFSSVEELKKQIERDIKE
ncbi:MAG: riboflavin biosynthesis protein RibF [Acutalibacteraceae bacterium]|nr:riboflavin biosynthesis protein RibF [Acutalibacteraceae bacterium]